MSGEILNLAHSESRILCTGWGRLENTPIPQNIVLKIVSIISETVARGTYVCVQFVEISTCTVTCVYLAAVGPLQGYVGRVHCILANIYG